MDFDINALMSNPMFLAGMNLLSSKRGDSIGGAILNGYAGAQSLQDKQQQYQMNALKLQQAQNAANFDPSDYMMTKPIPVGTGAATPTAVGDAINTPMMPSVLGGVGGGQTTMLPQPDMAQPISPQAGTPTGRVDMSGLLSGVMKAGMGPQDAMALANYMDPATATQQALASKMITTGPGQEVMNGLGTVIARNNNQAPNQTVQAIQQLTAQRDAARAAGNNELADTYQSTIDKMSGSFDQQIRLDNQKNLQAQRDTTNAIREQGQENQQTQKTQAQAVQLGTQLEKSGIPQAQQTLDNIDNILSKYPKNGDLPGYGPVAGSLPNWAVSKEGQELRQAVASLANINLKQRSGAAVTTQEYDRFKTELGNGTGMTPDRLRQGLTQMRSLIESQKKNYAAAAPDGAIEAYEANGGMPLSQYRTPQAKPASTSAPGATDFQAEARRRGLIQ